MAQAILDFANIIPLLCQKVILSEVRQDDTYALYFRYTDTSLVSIINSQSVKKWVIVGNTYLSEKVSYHRHYFYVHQTSWKL